MIVTNFLKHIRTPEGKIDFYYAMISELEEKDYIPSFIIDTLDAEYKDMLKKLKEKEVKLRRGEESC